jgi:hypothetical protein
VLACLVLQDEEASQLALRSGSFLDLPPLVSMAELSSSSVLQPCISLCSVHLHLVASKSTTSIVCSQDYSYQARDAIWSSSVHSTSCIQFVIIIKYYHLRALACGDEVVFCYVAKDDLPADASIDPSSPSARERRTHVCMRAYAANCEASISTGRFFSLATRWPRFLMQDLRWCVIRSDLFVLFFVLQSARLIRSDQGKHIHKAACTFLNEISSNHFCS